MDNKFKNIIIVILGLLLIISLITIFNLRKDNTQNNEKNNTINNSEIEKQDDDINMEYEVDEVEQKFDLIYTKASDYELGLVESRLTEEERSELQTLKNDMRNTKDRELRIQKSQEIKNKNREYIKKYITNSERKKIDNYQNKIDKIEEKYDEYNKVKFEIERNGTTSEKEKKLEELKKEVLEEIDKMGELE